MLRAPSFQIGMGFLSLPSFTRSPSLTVSLSLSCRCCDSARACAADSISSSFRSPAVGASPATEAKNQASCSSSKDCDRNELKFKRGLTGTPTQTSQTSLPVHCHCLRPLASQCTAPGTPVGRVRRRKAEGKHGSREGMGRMLHASLHHFLASRRA